MQEHKRSIVIFSLIIPAIFGCSVATQQSKILLFRLHKNKRVLTLIERNDPETWIDKNNAKAIASNNFRKIAVSVAIGGNLNKTVQFLPSGDRNLKNVLNASMYCLKYINRFLKVFKIK
jgi:hypothetical protein